MNKYDVMVVLVVALTVYGITANWSSCASTTYKACIDAMKGSGAIAVCARP